MVARAHHRVGGTARHLGEGGREQIGDDDERISHGAPMVPAHPCRVPIHIIPVVAFRPIPAAAGIPGHSRYPRRIPPS